MQGFRSSGKRFMVKKITEWSGQLKQLVEVELVPSWEFQGKKCAEVLQGMGGVRYAA